MQAALKRRAAAQPGVVLLMTLGHLTNDLYANSMTPIIPLLIAHFDLSLTQAGLLTTLRMLSGQMAQPLYGFLGDRMGRRWLLGLGPLLTVTIMGLTGWAPNYVVLALFMILAGVGTASFHPQGAALAGEASGRNHSLWMGIFLSGGSLGAALSPWLIVPIVSNRGLRATLLAAIPGIAVALFLLVREGKLNLGKSPRHRSWKLDFNGSGRLMVLLLAIAVSRTIVESSLVAFLPVLMQERGFTLMGAGGVLSLFMLAMAGAATIGGFLGDVFEPRRMIAVFTLLVVPVMQLTLRTEGALMVGMVILSGAFLTAPGSVNVSLAQRLAPKNAGTAASIMMGIGLGLGGLGATLVGRLADSVGLMQALLWLSWLPILPALMALLLPRNLREVGRE